MQLAEPKAQPHNPATGPFTATLPAAYKALPFSREKISFTAMPPASCLARKNSTDARLSITIRRAGWPVRPKFPAEKSSTAMPADDPAAAVQPAVIPAHCRRGDADTAENSTLEHLPESTDQLLRAYIVALHGGFGLDCHQTRSFFQKFYVIPSR